MPDGTAIPPGFSISTPAGERASTNPILTMANYNFYAIKQGRESGIVASWDECAERTQGYNGAEYKGFDNRSRAESWLNGGNCCTEEEQQNEPTGNAETMPPKSKGMVELHVRHGQDETVWFAVDADKNIVASGSDDSDIHDTAAAVEYIRRIKLGMLGYRARVERREQGVVDEEIRQKVDPSRSTGISPQEISADEVDGLCEEVTDKITGLGEGVVAFGRSEFNVTVGQNGPGAFLRVEDGEFVLELFQFETSSRRAIHRLSSKEQVLEKLNEQFEDGEEDEGGVEDTSADCSRCEGSGYLPEFAHVSGGVCFRCDGAGVEPQYA